MIDNIYGIMNLEELIMSKCLEEKILKKLFGYNGELATTGKSDFDFEILGPPGYVMIKLNGSKAELYFSNEWDYYLEEVEELSEKDIAALKKEGYEWQ